MAGPSRKEGLRCECGKLLLERNPETGGLGVRCGRDNCRKFHPLEEINRRAAGFEKENRRKKVEEKKIKGLKKIIRKAIKDKENVVELTMIGKNSFGYGTYTFTKERFIGIRDDIVIFDNYSTAPKYVPLANVESIQIRKILPKELRGNLKK